MQVYLQVLIVSYEEEDTCVSYEEQDTCKCICRC
jgi:hypothetical protein